MAILVAETGGPFAAKLHIVRLWPLAPRWPWLAPFPKYLPWLPILLIPSFRRDFSHSQRHLQTLASSRGQHGPRPVPIKVLLDCQQTVQQYQRIRTPGNGD